MDYIGASGASITVDHVPIIDNNTQIYLILAFAIDAATNGKPQNGKFSNYWADSITPKSIALLKATHPNVRVLMSLAGDSFYISDSNMPPIYWYDPESTSTWINNAVHSLTALAKKYHIDGVDIDYEHFRQDGHNKFIFCIGEVLKELKNRKVITVATIAPAGEFFSLYVQLHNSYRTVFDYINYQFYADEMYDPKKYLQQYSNVVKYFNAPGKVMMAIQLYGQGLHGTKFVSVVQELLKTDPQFPGVMIWDYDASAKTGFQTEKELQNLFSHY
ncbi:hypothetical protein O6H91_08G072100 [Diphasiastrum complanatum]|uniref:Uncharacterized protein n=1 Tax=Diphasiastrum complanatum TaxID=34168 RepID=A0ACC2CYT2_DIPCM|nr:hypothetical protein O6H91_08G072100 [Diphasiastrum complanatum]